MTRTATAAIVAGLLTFCAVLFALTAPTAPASAEAPAETGAGSVEDETIPASDAPAVALPESPAPAPESGAVRTTPQDGADTDQDGTVPPTGTDEDGTVPADGDGFDPTADALPADAPRVCVLLDMGAAACDAFTHPAPGEVSVAVIYSDDDEHAIVETIAYDSNGPIDYVDFWEGETTPSE